MAGIVINLGGVAEIAAATGQAKQTVTNWATRGLSKGTLFPAPMGSLASGRVWDMALVQDWCETNGYTWTEEA